jgi:predicted N-acyltransferase
VNLPLVLPPNTREAVTSAEELQQSTMLTGNNKTISWRIYKHTSEVDSHAWSQLHPVAGAFLCLDYLTALEEAHDEGLEIRLVMFYRGTEPLGIAAFQIAHFATSEDAYSNVFLNCINAIGRCIRGKHVHNILISGNAFATGEHGFSFQPDVDNTTVAFCLHHAMEAIAKQEQKRGRRICAMVTKDFYPETVGVADQLERFRFKKFQVDHNMVMPVLDEWNTFDDYLESLNTKFRTKAKSALKRSSNLRVVEADETDVLQHAEAMQRLYENVYLKADFRLGRLQAKALAELLKRIPNQFFVRQYFLNDQLVGFMTAMRCGDVIEAHVIGIDYDSNREHGVYQRILYDYVQLAIRLRCTRIVYGRTAAEIKSTVGAFPVNLTCSIKHRRIISNALLSMIINYVKPSEYPQRDPFKAETIAKIHTQPLYKNHEWNSTK